MRAGEREQTVPMLHVWSHPGCAANFCMGTKVGWTAGFSWRIGFRRTERFGAAELLSGDLPYALQPDVFLGAGTPRRPQTRPRRNVPGEKP